MFASYLSRIIRLPWSIGIWCHRRLQARYRPRFFDQVGHQIMYVYIGNKHFFTKSRYRQTYQNYEQSRQKLGTILENKVS